MRSSRCAEQPTALVLRPLWAEHDRARHLAYSYQSALLPWRIEGAQIAARKLLQGEHRSGVRANGTSSLQAGSQHCGARARCRRCRRRLVRKPLDATTHHAHDMSFAPPALLYLRTPLWPAVVTVCTHTATCGSARAAGGWPLGGSRTSPRSSRSTGPRGLCSTRRRRPQSPRSTRRGPARPRGDTRASRSRRCSSSSDTWDRRRR